MFVYKSVFVFEFGVCVWVCVRTHARVCVLCCYPHEQKILNWFFDSASTLVWRRICLCAILERRSVAFEATTTTTTTIPAAVVPDLFGVVVHRLCDCVWCAHTVNKYSWPASLRYFVLWCAFGFIKKNFGHFSSLLASISHLVCAGVSCVITIRRRINFILSVELGYNRCCTEQQENKSARRSTAP